MVLTMDPLLPDWVSQVPHVKPERSLLRHIPILGRAAGEAEFDRMAAEHRAEFFRQSAIRRAAWERGVAEMHAEGLAKMRASEDQANNGPLLRQFAAMEETKRRMGITPEPYVTFADLRREGIIGRKGDTRSPAPAPSRPVRHLRLVPPIDGPRGGGGLAGK
jgi:hypothetical protein